MLKVSILLTLFCLVFAISGHLNETTEGPLTTAVPHTSQFATIAPEIVDFLAGSLPDDYVLPDNVYLWNVSEIMNMVEASNPGLVCTAPTEMFAQFPVEKLKEMPLWAKYCHEMWCFANESEWQSAYGLTYDELGVKCNGTLAVESGCPYPLVTTNGWANSKYGKCGIACDYSGLLHGYTPQMMKAAFVTKCLLFSSFLVFGSVLALNQWMDVREGTSRPWTERPFFGQTTAVLTFYYAAIAAVFFVPEVIGLKNILCDANGKYESIVSMGNPRAGNTKCAALGFIAYFVILQMNWYTCALAVALWNELADPFGRRPAALRAFCREKGVVWMYTHVLGNKVAWHLTLALLALVFCAIAQVNNAVDAFLPLGLCYTSGRKTPFFWQNVFPYIFTSLALIVCLAHGIYLLKRRYQRRRSTAGRNRSDSQSLWAHFGCRLTLFAVGASTMWLSLLTLQVAVWMQFDRIIQSGEDRIFCVFSTGSKKQCYGVGYRFSPFFVHFTCYSGVLAVFGAMCLTFHTRALKRWGTYFPILARIGCCNVLMGTNLAIAAEVASRGAVHSRAATSKRTDTKTQTSAKTKAGIELGVVKEDAEE